MSVLGKALARRPRSELPIPLTSRRASSGGTFGGSGGGPSTLDQLNAMSSSGTLYAIIDATSTAVAATEWGLYRTPVAGQPVTDDAREPVTKHAALDLWNHPNPFFTRHELMETVQQHIDLTGLGYLILVKAGGIPVEMWFARPDRMVPVPSPTDFLTGWVYKTPDGDKIPFAPDEVICLRKPNPLDPYAGSSPVGAVKVDLDAGHAAAQWNRNFFENSAEPGGVIQVDRRLSDDEFDEMTMRWNEQHRGVARAHRVAVIEQGTYVPRGATQRDMQFAELRNVSRDVVMEGWRVSKTTLGISDDVNLANAKAAEYQFSQHLTVPRLRRWHEALNHRLLPMFGATGKGVEFDFDSPVRADEEADNAERASRAQAAATLVAANFDRAATLAWAGLPAELVGAAHDPKAELLTKLVIGSPSLAPLIMPMLGFDLPVVAPAAGAGQPQNRASAAIRNAADDPASEADLSGHDADYQAALAHLLAQWDHIGADQRAQLAVQIAAAVNDGDLTVLADLSVDSDLAAARLLEALTAIHRKAAQQAVDEAAAQQAAVTAAPPDGDVLGQVAAVTAALLAANLAVTAGREALRRHDGVKSGEQVAAEVKTYLTDLSTASVEAAAGGALAGTQNRARIDTWRDGPIGSFYADEQLDANTCTVCRAINGRFICTTEEFAVMDKLYTPLGGYVDCLGGARCRGTVTGVWRPQTVDDPGESP